MKSIDILLATYNGEKFVSELIESIICQSYKNIRLLICDDCSIDGTYKILEEYRKKDIRIKLFKNTKNIGSNKTFEKLMNSVESDFFMIADQDDIWNFDKVEKSIKKIYEEDSDLVFSDLEVVDENLNLISKSFNDLKGYTYKISKYLNDGYKLEILSNVVTGCTILTKKSLINKFLPLPNNNNIIYDYWIALVVSLTGKISYLNEATIKYRQHSRNQVGVKRYTDTLNSFEEVREHLINLKIENFKTFIEHKEIFSDEQNRKNIEALEYFKSIKNCKFMCISRISKFNKIYKFERKGVYIPMFFIMNFPFIARFIYYIRKILKK